MLATTRESPRARAFRASTLASHTQAVERVIGAMRANVAEPLSLEEMAEIAYLSPFHFNRVFRSLTGIPPGEFLAALRLDTAKRLLLTTSLSVTDVCFDLGYASLGTFATRFRQQIGVSPLRLRQLADGLADTSLQSHLRAHAEARRLAIVHTRSVHGVITAPDTFTGLIFVGLFPKPIPQSQPVACTTITAPGHFQIDGAPDGRYYLLAAALPWSRNALTYLAPDAGLLVGVAEQPTYVRAGQASAPLALMLRPLDLTDPPLLGVFPPLLAWQTVARAGRLV